MFDYCAGAPDKFYGETIPMGDRVRDFTLRESVGVCAQIVLWNFLLSMALWKVAPALAASFTLILKPASLTPLPALVLGQICAEAGVPEGVVSVLPGLGSEIGEALVSHPQVDKVAFAGEAATGSAIQVVEMMRSGLAASNTSRSVAPYTSLRISLDLVEVDRAHAGLERAVGTMYAAEGGADPTTKVP